MKTILAILLLLTALPLMGGEITFAWNPNPEPDIAGYRVFRRDAPTTVEPNPAWVMVLNVAAPNVTGTVTDPFTQPTEWAVTAYNNANLESIRSNVLTIGTKPGAPQNLRIQVIVNVTVP